MGAPTLNITIEPFESSSVVYGALAARSSNDQPNGQLSLVLTITNPNLPGSSNVHVNTVKVSFIGPPNMIPSTIAADFWVAVNATTQWYFQTANNIILPVPAPGKIKVSLFCDTYSDPAEVEMTLSSYMSGASDGGYPFPANTDDLKQGEFWSGQSAVHGPAGGGTQLFAYDLLVRKFDAASNSWPTCPPDKDNTVNSNYPICGKNIYAIADGVVKELRNDVDNNTPPGFPVPTVNPVEGNHFYIQHGEDLALYAHFQKGTLNPDLINGPNPDGTGAIVAKGQFLGLAGNSGNSSEPHLHIQVNRTTIPWGGPPRPLPFNNIYVLDLTLVPATWPPNSDAPWYKAQAQDLPSILAAIWPAPLKLGRGNLKWIGALAWAWIIIIGALMITPGGISCIACGPLISNGMGVISIALGILGFVVSARANRSKPPASTPFISATGDMHR